MKSIEVDKKRVVSIVYTNWKGETRVRKIVPESVWFGKTEWHAEDQWLLKALDVEKNAMRDFAMRDIRSWFVEG